MRKARNCCIVAAQQQRVPSGSFCFQVQVSASLSPSRASTAYVVEVCNEDKRGWFKWRGTDKVFILCMHCSVLVRRDASLWPKALDFQGGDPATVLYTTTKVPLSKAPKQTASAVGRHNEACNVPFSWETVCNCVSVIATKQRHKKSTC